MKPARAIVDRDTKPANVLVVRRVATDDRRARLVRLLSMLLDKPGTPGDGD